MSVESKNSLAIVTGGSAGIGKAICVVLAQSGYNIVVFDTAPVPDDLVTAAQHCGRRLKYYEVDVAHEQSVKSACDDLAGILGRPVLLVNNAGIYPRISALEMPYDHWQRVLAVNLGGAFLCSTIVARLMLAHEGGVIVNIASGRALQGAKSGAHYAASKAGILSLTKSLALEWAPRIRVNAVIPGVSDTAQPRQSGVSDADLYARGNRIPMQRIGDPYDTAWAVEYLASDRAAYITGQSLCVNGGAFMQ
jgi:NAD(P)-dependent dehydrogenase (short-subunit alcohol dehydrogenase family)